MTFENLWDKVYNVRPVPLAKLIVSRVEDVNNTVAYTAYFVEFDLNSDPKSDFPFVARVLDYCEAKTKRAALSGLYDKITTS